VAFAGRTSSPHGGRFEAEVLAHLGKQVDQAMRRAIRDCMRSSVGGRATSSSVSIPCTESAFRQAVWEQVPDQLQKNNNGRVYHIAFEAMEQLIAIVGTQHCSRKFPKGSGSFISPRATVIGIFLLYFYHPSLINSNMRLLEPWRPASGMNAACGLRLHRGDHVGS
jgi:hypothetical protein